MQLVQEAFRELYPNNPIPVCTLHYSGKCKAYSAVLKYRLNHSIHVTLAKEWKDASDELQIGAIQALLARAFKKQLPVNQPTTHMELYQAFLKQVERFAPVTNIDPHLSESFDRMNAQFFENTLDKPNLCWGKKTVRKMGHYNYRTDTILISEILKPSQRLLDYVMYHEMLHKKHRYTESATGKKMHHTTAFYQDEQRYPQYQSIEKELHELIHTKKRWSWF
jgi:hypothetical protein